MIFPFQGLDHEFVSGVSRFQGGRKDLLEVGGRKRKMIRLDILPIEDDLGDL